MGMAFALVSVHRGRDERALLGVRVEVYVKWIQRPRATSHCEEAIRRKATVTWRAPVLAGSLREPSRAGEVAFSPRRSDEASHWADGATRRGGVNDWASPRVAPHSIFPSSRLIGVQVNRRHLANEAGRLSSTVNGQILGLVECGPC